MRKMLEVTYKNNSEKSIVGVSYDEETKEVAISKIRGNCLTLTAFIKVYKTFLFDYFNDFNHFNELERKNAFSIREKEDTMSARIVQFWEIRRLPGGFQQKFHRNYLHISSGEKVRNNFGGFAPDLDLMLKFCKKEYQGYMDNPDDVIISIVDDRQYENFTEISYYDLYKIVV